VLVLAALSVATGGVVLGCWLLFRLLDAAHAWLCRWETTPGQAAYWDRCRRRRERREARRSFDH
jgi:hypothetical protein